MDKNKRKIKNKGGNDMTLLARPSNSMIIIDKNKSKKFLEDSKKNVISPSFLKQCLRFSKMITKGN